jgi:hypothetical protein
MAGIDRWLEHYFAMDVDGLGLSTYTKFLHFLNVSVEGWPALILDDRLIKVANRGLFSELTPLQGLATHNAAESYTDYLKCMHSVAKQISVRPDALELFLFTFGPHLKES